MITNYTEQRKVVTEFLQAAQEEKDRKLSTQLEEVIASISLAEKLQRVHREIQLCAQKNREFCLHCDSIAKVIEEFQK